MKKLAATFVLVAFSFSLLGAAVHRALTTPWTIEGAMAIAQPAACVPKVEKPALKQSKARLGAPWFST